MSLHLDTVDILPRVPARFAQEECHVTVSSRPVPPYLRSYRWGWDIVADCNATNRVCPAKKDGGYQKLRFCTRRQSRSSSHYEHTGSRVPPGYQTTERILLLLRGPLDKAVLVRPLNHSARGSQRINCCWTAVDCRPTITQQLREKRPYNSVRVASFTELFRILTESLQKRLLEA